MKRRLLLLAIVMAVATAASDGKVVICHATSSETNPFVTLEINTHAVYGPGGHFNENGTTQAGHEEDYFGPCLETSTTTTTSVVTTTTETPTTTQPEASTTTVTEGSTTTTSVPTGPAPVPPASTPTDPPLLTELPMTGFDPVLFAGYASVLATAGALLLRRNAK